jgi:hypothetical protein
MNADLIISLGPNCRNTWNIRKYFKIQKAYPFDWWITPAKSLLAMIEPEFEFQVFMSDLHITVPKDNSNTVYNSRLNILHHHDFDRMNGVVCRINNRQVDAVNDKYIALFRRFHNDLKQAEHPVAILNGVDSGWIEKTPNGQENSLLNGKISPDNLIQAIRAHLGNKLCVIIINIGSSDKIQKVDGGIIISVRDSGKRDDIPHYLNWAEPLHAFRCAYEKLSLKLITSFDPNPGEGELQSNNSPELSLLRTLVGKG